MRQPPINCSSATPIKHAEGDHHCHTDQGMMHLDGCSSSNSQQITIHPRRGGQILFAPPQPIPIFKFPPPGSAQAQIPLGRDSRIIQQSGKWAQRSLW